ncbi:MAG: hypothetical protein LBQ60_05190 [Bacteroidales bacterium]|nr:hypothetical protein [Bacteroidales bacterium]
MKLFKTLQKGREHLGAEALGRISCFVDSQRTEKDSFMDKSGKPDIYYTLFGWMLSYILGIRLDHHKMEEYLSGQNIQAMDLIHYAAFMRCRMIQKLMTEGKAGFLLKTLFSSPTKIKEIQDFTDLPHNDPQSPYTRFICLSLQEDTGQKIRDKAEILESLKSYHVPGGGYSNMKNGTSPGINATVAALAVTGQLLGYKHNEDIDYLRESQDESGGFSAAKEAPVPDILSTATSLFMLKCYGVQPKYAGADFIEAHWLDSGGFSATLVEERSDVEYTFYGLLALGSII